MTGQAQDVLAVLLLPHRLEGFEREAHARGLLSIPRVLALEPSPVRAPGFLRDGLSRRQARRLRFPGRLGALVLYHPAQYPLARALCAHHQDLELWYLPPGPEGLLTAAGMDQQELAVLDELARENATQVLEASGGSVNDEPLRVRLRELGVINPRAFMPGRQSQWKRHR